MLISAEHPANSSFNKFIRATSLHVRFKLVDRIADSEERPTAGGCFVAGPSTFVQRSGYIPLSCIEPINATQTQ